jgi:molecular chaperone GrpE
MTNEKRYEEMSEGNASAPTDRPQAQPAAPGAAPGEAAQDAAAGAQASPAPESEEVSRLKAEVADLKDRVLRAHAEMDNVRKRLEREKADQAKFAITKFARDVVGIGDNVQRAIDAVPHRLVEQDAALKSFVEGVTMIERELLVVLGRHGIKRLDPKGEPFDPHQHQAVVEVPSAEVPAGTITQVFQSGYMIEERVLRPAMVAVSKGGPKPQPAEAVAAEPAPKASENGSESPPSN